MKSFKIRASAASQIMGGSVGPSNIQLSFVKEMEARTKPMTKKMQDKYNAILNMRSELPQGAKTYCENWLKEQLYGRVEFSNKYTEKGNICEDEAISLLGQYKKNEEFFENDFMCGTPDLIISDDEVWDIKCSWDFSTFPLFGTYDNSYWWQLQVYMCLIKANKAKLNYCLINTPKHLDYREIIYDDLPMSLRIKTFDFQYDHNACIDIIERVKLCREYIHELLKNTNKDLQSRAPHKIVIPT
jgi:hypothetical protein